MILVDNRVSDHQYLQALKRAQALNWLKDAESNEPPVLPMELQDLYLSDPVLPSQTGKLTKDDCKNYPALAIRLGFIRAGTFSATTRTISLLHFCDEEFQSFAEYRPSLNPLKLNRHQILLFLYALLENDGEVVTSLFRALRERPSPTFSDRDAGNLMPEIFKIIIGRHRTRSLSIEARERLSRLEKTASIVARIREAKTVSGSSRREHISRVRVEPYVDLGLLSKADHFNHEYSFSPAGLVWVEAFENVDTSQQVEAFLTRSFFSTAAKSWKIDAVSTTDTNSIVPHLYHAWEKIQSPGGYSPIGELAIVGCIKSLLEHNVMFEIGSARDAIIAYQKANPYHVRFTVNRLGELAHARFLQPPISCSPQAGDG